MRKLQSALCAVVMLLCYDQSYACTTFLPSSQLEALRILLDFLKTKPSIIVVGKVISATTSTTILRNSSYDYATSYLINITVQFQVEKVIKGNRTASQVITISDFTRIDNHTGCSFYSKLADVSTSGTARIDTNKFIVILDTAATARIQSIWWGGWNPIYWTQELERQLDSASKLATTTNVAEQRKDLGFAVYPNPSQTRANIRYQMPQSGAAQVEISNYQGQVVQALEFFGQTGENVQELSVNGLANGVYFCRIRTQAGMQMQRIVVQR